VESATLFPTVRRKEKNVASGISEQQEENSMIFPRLPYFRWNLKAYGGIILQLEVNKMV
jgi:hypothetical protein